MNTDTAIALGILVALMIFRWTPVVLLFRKHHAQRWLMLGASLLLPEAAGYFALYCGSDAKAANQLERLTSAIIAVIAWRMAVRAPTTLAESEVVHP